MGISVHLMTFSGGNPLRTNQTSCNEGISILIRPACRDGRYYPWAASRDRVRIQPLCYVVVRPPNVGKGETGIASRVKSVDASRYFRYFLVDLFGLDSE